MLTISDLTYRIAGRTLLDKASLLVPARTKIGFVGRNGAGKTTLFRLITGEITPDGGEISLNRGVRIGQVAQEAPGTEQSLVEVVLEADKERTDLLAEAETATDPHRIAEIHVRLADIESHSAEARAAAILSGLGFDAAAQARPCSSFSGGWRMRVALAGVLFSAPDLLLLDEPTNYLDLEGTLWLENYLARYPHAVVLISHDRDLLNKAVDTIVHLDQGKLVSYRGGYDSFERQRLEAQALQMKSREKQIAERKHLQAFVDRFRAKASKARQAQSRMKRLQKMQTISAVVEDNVRPFHFPKPTAILAPPIITLDGVSVGYAPDKPVLSRLSLRIDDDDRIALLGSNGNGKSTFAKLIGGRLPPLSGHMMRAPKLSVAFFAQHQLDDLIPAQSPVEHVRARLPHLGESQIRGTVDRFGLPTNRMDTPAKDLSGGEKARLLMGLATLGGANLLILDEPTNHLDVDSRAALVDAVNGFDGAVILISHDRHLVESTADRLWIVADGGVRSYDGDLEDYRRLVLGNTRENRGGRDGGETSQARRKASADRRGQLAPLKKRIAEAEKTVEKLQATIARLDAQMADAAAFTADPQRGTRLAKERADAVRTLARAEEEWLELSSSYEQAMAAE
jgi:ATP-binding cassette subfamily F protein 3